MANRCEHCSNGAQICRPWRPSASCYRSPTPWPVAHAKGIIHRDLKPENILLSRDPAGRVEPKIVDFGIALLEERRLDEKLTQVGTVLGSPDYMSPEQARGEADVDFRTDIWSFCVVLYELISGYVPFDELNYNALLISIAEAKPDSLAENGLVDTELWAILEGGLAKQKEQRWRSMRELGEALAAWLLTQGVSEDVRNGSLRASWIDLRSALERVEVVHPTAHQVSSSARPRSVRPNDPTQIADPNRDLASTLKPRVISTRPPNAHERKAPKRGLLLLAAGIAIVASLGVGVRQLARPSGASQRAAAALHTLTFPSPASLAPSHAEVLADPPEPQVAFAAAPAVAPADASSRVRPSKHQRSTTAVPPSTKPSVSSQPIKESPPPPSPPRAPAAGNEADFGF
jgi:eukaryotic-like serine/threonine-protein kinase